MSCWFRTLALVKVLKNKGCFGRAAATNCSVSLRSEFESQRDSVLQPRVARNELPWVIVIGGMSALKGLCLRSSMSEKASKRNPLTVDEFLNSVPRVARSSPPRAEGHNPSRIEHFLMLAQ